MGYDLGLPHETWLERPSRGLSNVQVRSSSTISEYFRVKKDNIKKPLGIMGLELVSKNPMN